jgi:hypothetical protein
MCLIRRWAGEGMGAGSCADETTHTNICEGVLEEYNVDIVRNC